jgi:hypothetical protein
MIAFPFTACLAARPALKQGNLAGGLPDWNKNLLTL